MAPIASEPFRKRPIRPSCHLEKHYAVFSFAQYNMLPHLRMEEYIMRFVVTCHENCRNCATIKMDFQFFEIAAAAILDFRKPKILLHFRIKCLI